MQVVNSGARVQIPPSPLDDGCHPKLKVRLLRAVIAEANLPGHGSILAGAIVQCNSSERWLEASVRSDSWSISTEH